MKMMKDDIKKVLLSEEELHTRVSELGAQLSRDYEGKNLLRVSVLKGSVVFMADLMRAISQPAEIDFMVVSSYGSGVKSSGVVKIVKDLDINLQGKGHPDCGGYSGQRHDAGLYQGNAAGPQSLFDPDLHPAG